MKKCPYCAEEIQDDAIKCRFCGEHLNKKRKWRNCLLGCLIAFIISFLLLVLFIYLGLVMLKVAFHNYFSPFIGGGLGGMIRDFNEVFRALWERLRDFLYIGPRNYRITF